jgi:hypothetical protein
MRCSRGKRLKTPGRKSTCTSHRMGRGNGFSRRRGGARRCSPPGSDLARYEPSQEKWPEGSGGDQAQPCTGRASIDARGCCTQAPADVNKCPRVGSIQFLARGRLPPKQVRQRKVARPSPVNRYGIKARFRTFVPLPSECVIVIVLPETLGRKPAPGGPRLVFAGNERAIRKTVDGGDNAEVRVSSASANTCGDLGAGPKTGASRNGNDLFLQAASMKPR